MRTGMVAMMAIAFSVCTANVVPDNHLSLIESGSRDRLSKIMMNMSTEDALSRVPSLPKKIRELLKQKEKASFLRRSGTGSKDEASDGQDQRGVEEARKLLNEMGEESETNLDAEKIRCAELLDKQALALTAQRNELNNYNSQAAAARGRILESQQVISAKQEILPGLNDDLVSHRKKCAKNKRDLEEQLRIAKGDSDVIAGIIPMTTCNKALLQCKQVGNHADVTFRHPALRSKLAMLQSNLIRGVVRRTLNSIGSIEIPEKVVPPGTEVKAPGSEDRAEAQAKCSIRNSPNCQNLRDKFLMMQGEVLDLIRTLEEELAKNEAYCTKTEEDFVAQISDAETKLNDAQTVLAQSTKAELAAQEQCRLLDASIAQLEAEEREIQEECDKSISDLEMEICGIKQIRQELYKMSKMQKYIQDCEVSPWTAEECSASCLGGTQKLTRTVLVPATMGMECPPLEEKRACNDFICPIDCLLEDWTGWSACSAECGGGVKQRVRGMLRESAHGGEPCGATSDSEACNPQACDVNCVLAEWSEWSNCTKECDGGSQVRIKEIVEPVKGAGVCAADDSEERLQRKQCNMDSCVVTAKDGFLHCKSMIDVIILLDGSGSIGPEGWEATKKVGEALVGAFKTGPEAAQVAVLEFSGPMFYSNYKDCLSGAAKDFENECKIKWLKHWSDDAKDVAASITSAQWFGSTTLTSAALAMAEAEIGNGRRDAKKVTIVITDGRPLSVLSTRDAALKLRKKSRLMFVPVSRNAPIRDIMSWSTQPANENVIAVEKFKMLGEKETVNRIVADSCADLESFEEEVKPVTP